MELNKKQVGALLKVISKDTSREALTTLAIDRWGDDIVAVATDGYVLCALQLDKEEAEKIVTLRLRRSALEKWYKLATGKDRLTTQELVRVFDSDYGDSGSYVDVNYPEWQNLIPSVDVSGSKDMTFNADYAKTLQDLDGSEGMTYELRGELGAMMANTGNGTYLLMPKRKNHNN